MPWLFLFLNEFPIIKILLPPPVKAPDSPTSKEGAGRIVYELNGLQLSIPLYAADCDLRYKLNHFLKSFKSISLHMYHLLIDIK